MNRLYLIGLAVTAGYAALAVATYALGHHGIARYAALLAPLAAVITLALRQEVERHV